jgi:probable rRNA maturation factor
MAIHFYCEQVAKPLLKYRLITGWLKYVTNQHYCKVGNLSFIFCADKYLLELNNRYLDHDYYTDIITFDYVEKSIISGDIYISVERVADNSVKFGVNLEEEFLRVIVHGVLHLLNFDDKSENEKSNMRRLESDYISIYRKSERDGSLKI